MDSAPLNFAESMRQAVGHVEWSDTLIQPTGSSRKTPATNQFPIQVHRFEQPHSHLALLQLKAHIHYLFACPKPSASFSLLLYCFSKEDGTNTHLTVDGLRGVPSCIEVDLREWDGKLRMVGVVGIEDGFLKVIEFSPEGSKAVKSFYSHKLEQKPLLQVVFPDRANHRESICFVLVEDSKVMIFNMRSRMVVAVYQPPMLGHDLAVSMTLHPQGLYFATCSRSGQIVVWKLKQEALAALAKSDRRVVKLNRSEEKSIEEEEWQFKARDRHISVFPAVMLHSSSLEGLKWISFMGDLLALITSRGNFKIIAFDYESKDQFVTLIEYKISEGEAVSSARLFPLEETLVVFKASSYNVLLDSEEPVEMNAPEVKRGKLNALISHERGRILSRNCVKEMKGRSCLEMIRFGGEEMGVVEVKRRWLVWGEKQVRFDWGVISEERNLVLAGERNNFYIGKAN